jgi:hypothetical protein
MYDLNSKCLPPLSLAGFPHDSVSCLEQECKVYRNKVCMTSSFKPCFIHKSRRTIDYPRYDDEVRLLLVGSLVGA